VSILKFRFMNVFLLIIILLPINSCGKKKDMLRLDYYSTPQYTKDGKSILLSLKIDNKYNMFIYNSEDHLIKWIKIPQESGSPLSPCFSKDYSKIVFVWANKEKDSSNICIIDVNGENFKQITNANRYDFSPIFSKDSKKIYFLGSTNKEKNSVGSKFYCIDADGKNERQLSEEVFVSPGYISITSDDKYLIFSLLYGSEKTHNLENKLVKFDIPTGKTFSILDDKKYINPVACSNTQKIIFCGTNLSNGIMEKLKEGDDLYSEMFSGFFSIDIDGQNRKILLKESAVDPYLSISNDDKKILYTFVGKLREFDIESNTIRKIELDEKAIMSSYKQNFKHSK
jgi:hypothetical protein